MILNFESSPINVMRNLPSHLSSPLPEKIFFPLLSIKLVSFFS